MKELLSELREETSRLTSKSLGPIGFDYRGRTKLERLIFLITKEYCARKFKYDLGGLSSTHQKMFSEYVQERFSASEVIQVVKDAFEISNLIYALSSSDSYVREGVLAELGGTVYSMFENLGARIKQFISKVESACALV